MYKFKVLFSGIAYVVANSAEEAVECFLDGDEVYSEHTIDGTEEVDEFIVEV